MEMTTKLRSLNPRQYLQMVRDVHMLALQKCSRAEIQQQLKISYDTVYKCLATECPTEEEIASA
jgi:DNA-binding CsgD family transcriptional regulator